MHLLARNHLAGVLQQHCQYLDGLIGNPDLDSVATKLSRAQIQLERAKAEEAGWAWDAHRQQLLVRKSTTDGRESHLGLCFQLANVSNKSQEHT